MKVIFLDIDGVLISRRYASSNTADPRCVQQLNRITNRTGASIVITSTWRYIGLPKLELIFRSWDITGNIIGMTPESNATNRSCEIMEWIDLSDYDWSNSSFVVIDDEDDAMLTESRFVRTNLETGLEEVGADRAIAILEGYEP